MIKLENYLAADREAAIKESFCIETCLKRAQINIDDGNLDRANDALVDAMKSINEMKQLQNNKQSQDKFAELAHLATQSKVPLQVLVIQKK